MEKKLSPKINRAALNDLKALMKKNLYPSLINKFISSTDAAIMQISALLDQGDISAVGREAHSLKSSSRYLGADELSETAQSLEAAAHATTDPKNAGQQLGPLVRDLGAAWQDIRPFYMKEAEG